MEIPRGGICKDLLHVVADPDIQIRGGGGGGGGTVTQPLGEGGGGGGERGVQSSRP